MEITFDPQTTTFILDTPTHQIIFHSLENFQQIMPLLMQNQAQIFTKTETPQFNTYLN